MAVKIRLKRIGARKKPFYRIVVADARYPRDGRFIEQIGVYDPMTNPAKVVIDGGRVLYWMKNGAQPTDTVRALIKNTGALDKAREEEKQKPAVSDDSAVPYGGAYGGGAGIIAAEDTNGSDTGAPDIIGSDSGVPDLIARDSEAPDIIGSESGVPDIIARDSGLPDMPAGGAGTAEPSETDSSADDIKAVDTSEDSSSEDVSSEDGVAIGEAAAGAED
jgi:small subunit ribosomal protein S16